MHSKSIKNVFARSASIVLSATMLATSVPVTSFAEEVDASGIELNEEVTEPEEVVEDEVISEEEVSENSAEEVVEPETSEDEIEAESTEETQIDTLTELKEVVDEQVEESDDEFSYNAYENKYSKVKEDLSFDYYTLEELAEIDWMSVTSEDFDTINLYTSPDDMATIYKTWSDEIKQHISELSVYDSKISIELANDNDEIERLTYKDFFESFINDNENFLKANWATKGAYQMTIMGQTFTVNMTSTGKDNTKSRSISNSLVHAGSSASYISLIDATNKTYNEWGNSTFNYNVVITAFTVTKPAGYKYTLTKTNGTAAFWLYGESPDKYTVEEKDDAIDYTGKKGIENWGTNGAAYTMTAHGHLNIWQMSSLGGGGLNSNVNNVKLVIAGVPITYTVSWNGKPGTYSYGTTYSTPAVSSYVATKTGSYTVSYNTNGGSACSATAANWSQSPSGWSGFNATFANLATIQGTTVTATPTWNAVSYGKTNLPTSTKTGYTFKGWSTTNNNTPNVNGNTTFKANTTLYACWQANTFTVYYNANGGLVNPTSNTGTYPNYPTAPTPSRANYKVTFDKNGGTTGGGSIDGTFTFGGWSNPGVPTAQGGSCTRVASWTDNGVSISKAPATSKNGYTFKGWYTAKDGGTQVTGTYKPGTNATLYAQYAPNTYKITYDANGGTVTPTSQDVTYDATCPQAPTPTRKGYTFTGWTGGQYSGTYTTAGNTTVTAQWTPIKYTVSYVGFDGITDADKKVVNYDEEFTTREAPTKAGYKFNGWKMTNGNVYQAGAKAKNLSDVNDSTVTLEAQWVSNKVKVTFDVNNGNAITPITYDMTSTELLPKPTRSNYLSDDKKKLTTYIFKGWINPDDETKPDDARDYYTSVQDLMKYPNIDNLQEVTLKALWNETVTEAGDNTTIINNYDTNPAPAPTPGVTEEDIKEIKALLAQLKSTSDLNKTQLESLYTYVTNEFGLSNSQAKALIDLIMGNSGLSEAEKLALIQAITNGQLTDVQKSLLLKMISTSSLSDADKKALLSAINGISSLSAEQQKEILSALERGSSADLNLNGVTYRIHKTNNGTLSIAIKGLNGQKDVVIPDSITVAGKTYPITAVDANAFKGNKEMKSVTMGDNITSIGDSAFEGCSKLEKVQLGENLKDIGNNAFKGCTALSSITLPASLQTIGQSAFENCTKLKTVTIKETSNLLEIKAKSFKNTGLTTFTVPNSVIKIGKEAFANNKNLKSFKFKSDSKLVTIDSAVWQKDAKLKSIKLPSKLTVVPKNTFKGDKSLKSVKLGSNVTEIGASAFEQCTSMTSISISGKVSIIGKKAFYGDKKLKKVNIKTKMLSKVGAKAFKKCKKTIKFSCPKNKLASYKKLLKGKY